MRQDPIAMFQRPSDHGCLEEPGVERLYSLASQSLGTLEEYMAGYHGQIAPYVHPLLGQSTPAYALDVCVKSLDRTQAVRT